MELDDYSALGGGDDGAAAVDRDTARDIGRHRCGVDDYAVQRDGAEGEIIVV